MDLNVISSTIDELNNRMETALDKDDKKSYEVLHDFYEWFVEKYVL